LKFGALEWLMSAWLRKSRNLSRERNTQSDCNGIVIGGINLEFFMFPMSVKFPFSLTKKQGISWLVVVAIGMLFMLSAHAGTTDTEFEALYTLMDNWSSGYLAKSLAIAAFIMGAGIGIAKQTVIPAIIGIALAVVFSVGPSVIKGMLTATI
jgi:conjugal transfer pilus assembly protein TraA